MIYGKTKGNTLIESLFAFEIYLCICLCLFGLYGSLLKQQQRIINEQRQISSYKEEFISQGNLQDIVHLVLH